MCETDVRGQLGARRRARSAGSGSSSTSASPAARPEADVRRVVETADRLSPLLANLSPAIERVHRVRIVHIATARRRDMDPRVFRRVQRYGWDAATERLRSRLGAADRGADRHLRCAGGARAPASACWIWRPGPACGAFAAARAVGAPGAVTGHRRLAEDGDAGEPARRERAASATSCFQRRDMEATGARRRRVRRRHLRVRADVRRRSRGRVRARWRAYRAGRAGVGLRLGAARRVRLRGGVPDRRRPRRERGLPAVLRARAFRAR